MSFDPQDAFEGNVISDCCGALVMEGGMCSDCKEHCESVCEGEGEELDEEGPTDAQQELSRAGHEASESRYREQMKDAGRGALLP